MIGTRVFLLTLGVALANPILRDPSHPAFKQRAPEHFRVRLETTKGPIVIACHREWAPTGADRFFQLVTHGYYDDACFFRVIEGAWAQFGIQGDPGIAQIWRKPDDRTTQLFINLRDNPALDSDQFAPIGEVIEGMEVADFLYAGYADRPGGGIRGGQQDPMFEGGNGYFRLEFPKLDFITKATILP
jgi:homoserine O-acetyltransferase